LKRLSGYLAILAGIILGASSLVVLWNANLPGQSSIVGTIIAFMGASAAVALIALGKRLAARTAADVREHDPRRPIVLLRNFHDDFLKLKRSMFLSTLYYQFFAGETLTLEELIARKLSRFGPVVAVARPGQRLPPTGFARMWLSDEWKDKVEELIHDARLVVLVLGEIRSSEEGFGWELATVLKTLAPERVVVAVPPSEDTTELWASFCKHSCGKLTRPMLSFSCCFITFSQSWKLNKIGLSGKQNTRQYRKALDEVIDMKRPLLDPKANRIHSRITNR
jgi:hypothetical protein